MLQITFMGWDYAKFAATLKRHRKGAGLTQHALSVATGINRQRIAGLESGTTAKRRNYRPTTEESIKFANALRLSVEELSLGAAAPSARPPAFDALSYSPPLTQEEEGIVFDWMEDQVQRGRLERPLLVALVKLVSGLGQAIELRTRQGSVADAAAKKGIAEKGESSGGTGELLPAILLLSDTQT